MKSGCLDLCHEETSIIIIINIIIIVIHFLMVLTQFEQRKCWFYEEISKITYQGFTGE